MQTPRYAVNGWSTPHNTAMADIEQVARTGGQAVGLRESDMGVGEDERLLEAMEEHGLAASFFVPSTWTILPVPFNVPGMERDPRERTELLCRSIERLARFKPAAIVVGPGVTGVPDERAGPAEVVAEGVAAAADVAAEHGLQIGFELLAQRRGATHHTLPEAVAFLDELDRDNVGVMFDTWHSWCEPGLHESLRRYGSRINSVHVNDVRPVERSNFDRVLPGQGRKVAAPIIATLIEAGYDGWWELEVFSDDGTFGNDFADSLWKLPHEELLARAKVAFDEVWAEALAIVANRAQERADGGIERAEEGS
jgi:sugar phosphate isomerase/epimerase